MRNEWLNQTYQIKQHAEGKILTEEVSGQVCGGFGIHETAVGWNITHLRSGWATFMSRTAEGAQMTALYLIENYTAEFECLNIKGCLVENFKPLAERIEADTQLWNLRKLYAVPRRELDRWGREMQPKMRVIS